MLEVHQKDSGLEPSDLKALCPGMTSPCRKRRHSSPEVVHRGIKCAHCKGKEKGILVTMRAQAPGLVRAELKSLKTPFETPERDKPKQL